MVDVEGLPVAADFFAEFTAAMVVLNADADAYDEEKCEDGELIVDVGLDGV